MAARPEYEHPLSVSEKQDLLVLRCQKRKPFPQILRTIKDTYRVSYSAIAEAIGLTKMTMCKWRKGEGIRYEHLMELYHAFQCLSIDELTLSVYPELWLCQQAEAMGLPREELNTVYIRLGWEVPDEVVYMASIFQKH